MDGLGDAIDEQKKEANRKAALKRIGDEPINVIQEKNAYDMIVTEHYGLSRREYFAVQILKGLCVPCTQGGHNSAERQCLELPTHAVMLADALIAELYKGVVQ